MKKSVAFILTAALCCSLAVPVFAGQVTEPGNKTMDLTYSVDVDYMVSIPETANLNQTLTISSGKANTEPNKAVKVQISGLTDDGKAILYRKDNRGYAITAAAKQNEKYLKNNDVIATFADVTTDTQADPIEFDSPVAASGGEIKAGSYTGQLTFIVSYTDLQ